MFGSCLALRTAAIRTSARVDRNCSIAHLTPKLLGAAIAGVLITSVAGGSAFAVTGYSADGAVNVRPAPNTSQAPLTTTANGQALDIICQTYGQNVAGMTVWDYTAVNGQAGFISDNYVNGTPYAVLDSRVPNCVRTWGQTWGSDAGAPGQCTYGALLQFHNATGVYPQMWGDAKDWKNSAPQFGWKVVLDAEPLAPW